MNNSFMEFWTYFKAAFNAKLKGMFVSPNWVMICIFVLSGMLLNPGFFLIGGGIEIFYLFILITNPRFQRLVQYGIKNQKVLREQTDWQSRITNLVLSLAPEERKRFNDLRAKCNSIIEFYTTRTSSESNIIQHHQDSLNKLMWIFLQLLSSRQIILKLTQAPMLAKKRIDFEQKIKKIEESILTDNPAAELKKSLESKRDILKLRLSTLNEAEGKLVYIEAELDRIEQQVELIKEQAAISNDPQGMAASIDSVSSSLGETAEWIKQQENIFSSVQNVMETVPAILTRQPGEKEQ